MRYDKIVIYVIFTASSSPLLDENFLFERLDSRLLLAGVTVVKKN